ncbi:hypothetical protein EDC96DRAFT_563003 [Choanephora cucurbitarum]|nr:hypothetical protein EDC96DRAFT_563003 [Choanephora cucurbitarum]
MLRIKLKSSYILFIFAFFFLANPISNLKELQDQCLIAEGIGKAISPLVCMSFHSPSPVLRNTETSKPSNTVAIDERRAKLILPSNIRASMIHEIIETAKSRMKDGHPWINLIHDEYRKTSTLVSTTKSTLALTPSPNATITSSPTKVFNFKDFFEEKTSYKVSTFSTNYLMYPSTPPLHPSSRTRFVVPSSHTPVYDSYANSPDYKQLHVESLGDKIKSAVFWFYLPSSIFLMIHIFRRLNYYKELVREANPPPRQQYYNYRSAWNRAASEDRLPPWAQPPPDEADTNLDETTTFSFVFTSNPNEIIYATATRVGPRGQQVLIEALYTVPRDEQEETGPIVTELDSDHVEFESSVSSSHERQETEATITEANEPVLDEPEQSQETELQKPSPSAEHDDKEQQEDKAAELDKAASESTQPIKKESPSTDAKDKDKDENQIVESPKATTESPEPTRETPSSTDHEEEDKAASESPQPTEHKDKGKERMIEDPTTTSDTLQASAEQRFIGKRVRIAKPKSSSSMASSHSDPSSSTRRSTDTSDEDSEGRQIKRNRTKQDYREPKAPSPYRYSAQLPKDLTLHQIYMEARPASPQDPFTEPMKNLTLPGDLQETGTPSSQSQSIQDDYEKEDKYMDMDPPSSQAQSVQQLENLTLDEDDILMETSWPQPDQQPEDSNMNIGPLGTEPKLPESSDEDQLEDSTSDHTQHMDSSIESTDVTTLFQTDQEETHVSHTDEIMTEATSIREPEDHVMKEASTSEVLNPEEIIKSPSSVNQADESSHFNQDFVLFGDKLDQEMAEPHPDMPLFASLETDNASEQTTVLRASESQSNESQAGEYQASEYQASRPQDGESEASGSQAAESEASGSQASESQASESQAAECQAIEYQASGSQDGESEASGSQAAESEASQSLASQSQASESEASESQASDSQTNQPEEDEPQTNDSQVSEHQDSPKPQEDEGETMQEQAATDQEMVRSSSSRQPSIRSFSSFTAFPSVSLTTRSRPATASASTSPVVSTLATQASGSRPTVLKQSSAIELLRKNFDSDKI